MNTTQKYSVKRMSLTEFLSKHQISKDGNNANIEKTNTRIADHAKNIYGGSYNIPDDEYDKFLELNYNEIIKGKKEEYLTEKQRESDGPISIDVDLRYEYNITDKQYTKAHISDLIDTYLVKLKKIYQFDDTTDIPIFVFEKSKVNRLKEKNYTKDGIHMIIGIQSERSVQIILREQIIEEIKNIWDGLPIINKWEDVFDEGISKGSTNWQLYGSCKPNHESYKLTRVYNINYDTSDGEFIVNEIPLSDYDIDTNYKKLSIRYTGHQFFFLNSNFEKMFEQRLQNIKIKINSKKTIATNSNRNIDIIRNREDLELAVIQFLDSINPSDDKKELKDTFKYTMALPESYYGDGSYTKWTRVGMALRNIDESLIIVWIAMSAKSPDFSFDNIEENIYKKWYTFSRDYSNGLTKRSIMYWAKEDNPSEFNIIQRESVDFYIEKTINSTTIDNIGKNSNGISGCGDWDLAEVLYHMYKDEYICASIKKNIWYKYKNHKWSLHEDANDLRKGISEGMRNLYNLKATKIAMELANPANGNEEIRNKMQNKFDKILNIMQRLAKTNDKQNIIKEARTMFYDDERNFLENLDSKEHLLCFKNGIIDFNETDKNKMFRKGYPEDEISMCTGINYVRINLSAHKPIMDEINEFMYQLFPINEIREYMWQHLASTLIGIQREESFNMYIGKGRNGKSKLIDLMKMILGDYKSDVPISLVTDKRTKLGGCAPEIQNLKGVRYAVISEPSKGDRLNDGAMKMFTGGDAIEGRGLWQEKATKFKPQFKLVVCSNQFMEIKSNDDGTWRRIRVVDFVSKFNENPRNDDPDYPYQFLVDSKIHEKFNRIKEVFMSMLVDIAFDRKGIVDVPEAVIGSSKKYRDSQDYISEFIHDKIINDPNGKIKKTELNSEFQIWYMSTYGRGGPPPKEVHAYMDKAFGKAKTANMWVGVKIRYDRDEIADVDENYDDIDISEL